MIMNLITKIFGTSSERETKKLLPLVQQINEQYEALADADQAALIAKTRAWQDQLREAGEELEARLQEAGKTSK
jgi:preprotein translocase subunit SecA